jgi:UMF1 family MFS transporter
VALRIIIAVWATTPLVSVHNHNRRTVLCYCRRSRFVMGGVQSLSSRSTYAKLIPDNTKDTASHFGF